MDISPKSFVECQVCVPSIVNIKTEIGYSTSLHQNTTDLTQWVCVFILKTVKTVSSKVTV